MHPTLRFALRMSTLLWVLALLTLLATLAGCGGNGDDAEDSPPPGATTQPVDCKLHPEQCP